MNTFSWKLAFVKGLKYIVLFGLPILVNQFVVAYPQWAQLSVGGALVMLCNYLKQEVGLLIP